MLIFGEGGKPENPEKNPRSREENQHKLNPLMASGPGIEPGPHWWEASALTTTPSLLSFKAKMHKALKSIWYYSRQYGSQPNFFHNCARRSKKTLDSDHSWNHTRTIYDRIDKKITTNLLRSRELNFNHNYNACISLQCVSGATSSRRENVNKSSYYPYLQSTTRSRSSSFAILQ